MFAVFNRFNPAYEEAARDQGATQLAGLCPCRPAADRPRAGGGRAVRLHPVSYDEIARTILVSQAAYNTLPLEIWGMTTNVTSPVLYALGTLTTLFSLSALSVLVILTVTTDPAPPGKGWVGCRKRDGLMRLVVINPNSTVSMTDKAAAAARAAALGQRSGASPATDHPRPSRGQRMTRPAARW